MREKLTPHVKALSANAAISGQYCVSEHEQQYNNATYNDPLLEDEHEVVKGLVHKYSNRALIKVSYQCAAHCRFCTRIRQIGDIAGALSEQDIEAIAQYLILHPEIDDVILSGGDPFYTAKLTRQLLLRIKEIGSVKVLRIGTRLPLQSPHSFFTDTIHQLLDTIDEVAAQKPFYILLHVNHPDELTDDVLKAIALLRSHKVMLLSQTVFLKSINDSYEVLYRLYNRLYHLGVVPYYLYHCDAVEGIQHFAVAIEKEKEIVTRLTATLSGIACPTYIIDIEKGHGKIPVPLNFINNATGMLVDFKGEEHQLK